MKLLNVAVFSVILLSMVSMGRAPDNHPIPIGTYFADRYPDEEILVLQSEIRFRIGVNKDFLDRQYKYTVLTNGRIQPFPMTSSEVLLGVGSYDWYWDGKAIIRQNPKTGEIVKFRLKEGADRER